MMKMHWNRQGRDGIIVHNSGNGVSTMQTEQMMFTPYRETYSANKDEPTLSRNPLLIAVPIGIALGFCLQLLFTGFSFWASLALWPLSLAISLIFISVLSQRLHNKAQWGLVVVGQLLGALGILMLLLSSL